MSTREGFGQRRVKVTPKVVEAWLVNSGKTVRTDLPNDARFLRMYSTEEGGTFYFVFESEYWDERLEGDSIPVINVELEEISVVLRAEK